MITRSSDLIEPLPATPQEFRARLASRWTPVLDAANI
jgi:hypothetical protein